MKIALVTTTINVPHVLKLYRKAGPDVRFFVAGDIKTPLECWKLCDKIGNADMLSYSHQLAWKCSDLIGWNCIQRRNIATLEALKWGADTLVFVDDDNIPTSDAYFFDYELYLMATRFDGLLAHPEHDWFDVGTLYEPYARHRGFPHQVLQVANPRMSFVTDAQIGAHAGLVIGDPDVSANTRIACRPHVRGFAEILRNGIAVDPRHTHTVFNTQNSAVIRDLAPAMLLCPQFKRYDDIIASLVCQRVMRDTGHHVLFGPPVVYQERNPHDLTRDLVDEAWGAANLLRVSAMLDDLDLRDCDTVTSKVRAIYRQLDELMPGVEALAEAWCDDVETAIG